MDAGAGVGSGTVGNEVGRMIGVPRRARTKVYGKCGPAVLADVPRLPPSPDYCDVGPGVTLVLPDTIGTEGSSPALQDIQ